MPRHGRNFCGRVRRSVRVTTAHGSPSRTLPTVREQAERLISLGIPGLAGVPAEVFRAAARTAPDTPGLLVVHPDLVRVSALAPLLRRAGRPGFVVADMTDVDDFGTIDAIDVPPSPVYLVLDLDRGDAMADWSPAEALPAILGSGRSPLTLSEGAFWLLQQPEVLARGHCFMAIGSRRQRPDGKLDARTPAIWISNGTGRDGPSRREAPKVGWCWAGNRHTWLGFASARTRHRT